MIEGDDFRVARALIDILSARDMPARTRQAAAASLQRMLGLRHPPIEPDSGRQISPESRRDLVRIAEQRLR